MIYLTLCLLLQVTISWADSELKRRASWGAQFEPFDLKRPGKVVRNLDADSTLAQAGIQKGDRLVSVNHKPIHTAEAWNDITDALTEGVHQIRVIRDASSHEYDVDFSGLAKETHPGIKTIYHQITSDHGIKQRVIVTLPASGPKKHKGMVVLQGLSCSSIEQTPGRQSAFVRLLTDLIRKSDRAVLRIEKPGMGDSEGDCSNTDFATELNGYETAIRWFLAQDYVDADEVIVYGNSMGSALAPYMANQFNLAGVVSDGTYVRSWFEHMLEIERRILAFKGLTQQQITEKMTRSYIPLYYGMLVEKKSYQKVIDEKPNLVEDNYHGPGHMYGRPVSFYHQLQQFDVAGAWEQLKVPARIRWGTHDWIMSEADNDLIVEILKQAGHKDHVLYKHESLDHWQAIHPNPLSSFEGKKGQWDDAISGVLLDWIARL